MKYINKIDSYYNTITYTKDNRQVVKRPEQGYGLLWLEIRLRMAWACLIGKADAVTFEDQ